MLFSCAVLRSLRIGPCRLSPPATVSPPSLEELLLTRVSDDGEDVQRLISACPRLTDLTLEDCDMVTALSLLDRGRLRRLALRCCHKLVTVTVDTSGELHTLEYRGAVPDQSFMTMHGGGGSSVTSCKVDICAEDSSSAEELTKLRDFLQLLAPSTTHLHLHSPRLGSSIEDDAMSPFPHLRHLELRGRLPYDSTASSAIVVVSRILQHAPSLEVLTLVFETGTDWVGYNEGELHDAHHLRYEEHDEVLALPVAAAPPPAMIPCLRNGRVREIPVSVVDYAVPSIIAGELAGLLDGRAPEPSAHEAEAVELVAHRRAVHCVRLEGKDRPAMADIVANLESAFAMCEGSAGGGHLVHSSRGGPGGGF